MSNPENRLSKFRSYSYKHVLVACSTTAVAEEISTSLNVNDYDKENGVVNKSKTNNGEYIVIINGFSDGNFIIDDVKWISTLAPEPGPNNREQFQSYATEGSLRVIEPRGVEFLNNLAGASDKLQLDPTAVVYMLKTFFVGMVPETSGPSRVDHMTNVKPLTFIIADISANFDFSGAEYNIEFVSTTNGIAKLGQYNNGADRVSFELMPTMGDSLYLFRYKLQEQYDAHFRKLTNIAAKAGTTLVGKPIRYIVHVDPLYQDYEVNQTPEYLKNKGVKVEQAVISFGQNSSIESALGDIMHTSKQFGDDAIGKNKDNKPYMPKILSTIHSTPDEFSVIFSIVRIEVPRSTLARIHDEDQDFASNGNSIEFDYYFAGQNVDILDFNIQMKMGLAFFQTISTAESIKKTQKTAVAPPQPHDSGSIPLTIPEAVRPSAVKGTQTEKPDVVIVNNGQAQSASSAEPSVGGPRTGTPIPFSTLIKQTKQKNKVYPLASSNFQELLRRHAAYEMLDAKIRITGNPQLLNNMILTPSEIADQKKPEEEEDDVFRNWTHSPGLVKVHIFMPPSNGDRYSRSKETKFWYDGWYYIVSVEHVFSGGEFTQEIDMFSLPVEKYLKDNNAEESEPDGEYYGAFNKPSTILSVP